MRTTTKNTRVIYEEKMLKNLKKPHMQPPEIIGNVRLSSSPPKSDPEELVTRFKSSLEEEGHTKSLSNTRHQSRNDPNQPQP